MNEKYRISIPYRNREGNLNKIIPILNEKFKGADFKIQVVEQNNNLPFNIAYLINIGFNIFNQEEKDNNWTYIFHPVDCYPIDVDYNIYNKDIIALTQKGEYWPKGFCYKPSSYIKMNGYSNDYWGWGGEDHEPEKKCQYFNLEMEKRFVNFDNSEDISEGNNLVIDTNAKNINICASKTEKDFYSNGLNTISYDIINESNYIDHSFYKVNFK